MTRDPLCFDEIEIVRAPGFQTGGFAVEDLCSGINVVHGPNAAGKTTLAESIEWLCWPETAEDRASLVGQLSVNGDSWRVELDRGRPSYQRNGQEANGPSLPPADQRDRYRLSLHDLLQQETRNESFAETIERESAGGYDLAAAYDELEYSNSPSRANKNVVQNAERAIDELRAARSEVSELRNKQHKLSRLRNELEEARRAQDRVDLLDQAIDYAEARDALEKAEARRDEFPDVLERVDGDESDRVQTLEEKIQTWTDKKNEAQATKEEAEDQLDSVNLPDEGVPNGRIDHLKSLRDDLDSAEDRKRTLTEDLTAAKQKRENAKENLPLETSHQNLAELEPVTWQTVSKFVRKAQQFQAESETREAVDRLLSEGEQPETDPSTLKRASQSLEEWLATSPESDTAAGTEAFRIALVSAISLAAAAIALGVLVHPLLFSILLVAAGILWYGVRARSQSSAERDPRQPHRESFQQTGLTPPESWKPDAVRSRLIELYDAMAAHKLAEKRADWRDSLATDQETLEDMQQELAETRSELQEKLGAAPDASDVELAVISKRVLDWQEANDDVDSTQSRLETVDDQIESIRGDLTDELEPYEYDPIETSGEATEAIRNLERREQQRESAQKDLERAIQTIDEATAELDTLEEERAQIFVDLDLEPGAHVELEALCEQVGAYETATTEVQEAEIRARAKAEELEQHPDFESDLKERTVAELRSSRREAEQTAAEYESIQSQVADIEAEIRQAKGDDKVETALADRDRALDALQEQLEDDCAAMVGDVLVDHLQEATMETSRPEVFKGAREILATITRGRYRLDFDEAEGKFRVFDEAKQKGLALDELSSGTRVQVLLAVRLAFVEHQEQGVQIPILLDETLANSDDTRARTIIESAIELARNGRQLFYFTAQGDEVAKWTAAIDDATGVDHQVIDLAAVRDLDESVMIPDLDFSDVAAQDPPGPEGHDHDSYGEVLGVEPFNPHRGAGRAHLWYVVDDTETLYQLLEFGIERWGQLHNLLERGRQDVLIDDAEQLTSAQHNAAALEAFVEAWKVGRGKPVDREVLEASGAVSSNFIDDVTDLAESVNGDGRQIVEALHAGQVNRFRSGKANELERYLEDHGYIEPRETLDRRQIRIRVIEAFVDQGLSREEATERTDTLLSRLGR